VYVETPCREGIADAAGIPLMTLLENNAALYDSLPVGSLPPGSELRLCEPDIPELACATGKQPDPSLGACVPCPRGQYSPDGAVCLPCEEGYTTEAEGAVTGAQCTGARCTTAT
jgi:hypothetical protein